MDGKVNYYAVLGVEKSASLEEVRKAFQGLAKALHPDSGNESPAAAAQFQRVKEAYDVLRDRAQRDVYDKKLSMHTAHSYDPADIQRRAAEFRRTHQNRDPGEAGTFKPAGQAKFVRALELMTRPRFLVLAPFIAVGSWWLAEKLSPSTREYHEYGERVPAWFNPTTYRWETPAPWDPLFQANRHTLKVVLRRDVYLSTPPVGASVLANSGAQSTTSSSVQDDDSPQHVDDSGTSIGEARIDDASDRQPDGGSVTQSSSLGQQHSVDNTRYKPGSRADAVAYFAAYGGEVLARSVRAPAAAAGEMQVVGQSASPDISAATGRNGSLSSEISRNPEAFRTSTDSDADRGTRDDGAGPRYGSPLPPLGIPIRNNRGIVLR